MGLDVGDAHWSYGGFHRFREKIAASIGIDLDEMLGFKVGLGGIEWPDHPLTPLLNHSDCDGEISASDCLKMAPILRQVLSMWVDNELNAYDKKQGLLLAEAMEESAKNNEPLEFH